MNKIAILMPYFGKQPIWFDLFLYSCSKNSHIDFIFFSDCLNTDTVYRNTIFKKVSFEDYCKYIAKKLNITFSPEKPYKLCDVRPFYAFIHRKELEKYDYWGYGDMDVIYGDLSIITQKLTRDKELITTHADRIAGHFTIIKKDSRFSYNCFKIKDYKIKLAENYVYGLDEHDFTLTIYPMQKFIWTLHRWINKVIKIHYSVFFDFFNKINNLFSNFYIKEFYTTPLPKNKERWVYDIKNNKVLGPDKEIPYLHFLFFKKNPFYKKDIYWTDNSWSIDIKKINLYNYIEFDENGVRYVNQ